MTHTHREDYTPGERLVRIETLVENLNAKFDAFLKLHEDHENRIRSLEKTRWVLAGLAAAVGAFGREMMSIIGGG